LTRDARLFAAGAAIVTLHLVDVVAWRPAVVLALGLLAYRFAPATARAALGLVAAAAAVMGAYLHVLHIRWDGLARTDITGVALFAASALFAAAAVLALLSRRPLRPARRAVRAVATAAAAIPLLLFAVVPVAVAMWLGGKPRQPLEPASLPVAHRDVTLRSSDGTKLSGWYVPSRNGGAVVLVHGGGGDRNGVRRHALLLARHGYGVLFYDERGRGRSGGATQSMGWNWVPDVEAAVAYLQAQRGVRRVGALGLSTGAEVVVTAAAHDPRIRAVVAEGLINRNLADSAHQRTIDDITGLPYWAVTFAALRVVSGTHPPEALTDDLRAVAPRPLLVVAARRNAPERAVASTWARAAGPTARLWLADAGHTRALATHPRLYERRVTGFFAHALLPR
jgi:pimeloyl-ACP methyl ester carboxylesterase